MKSKQDPENQTPTFVTYKNAQIHYIDQGAGAAVVLLHGFLENVSMWKVISGEISKSKRVVGIDLLGHGLSENVGYVHSMEQMAESVRAVLRYLRIRKYVFVGHSMGGYVALAFAKLYPTTVKGLCLLNSTAQADGPEKKVNRERAISMVKKKHHSFIRNAIPMLFSSKNKDLFRAEIELVKKEALKTSKQGVIAALEGMKNRRDQTVLFKQGPFTKMAILGKKDPVLELRNTLRQFEDKGIKIIQLSGGHMSHIENKEGTIAALVQFVKQC